MGKLLLLLKLLFRATLKGGTEPFSNPSADDCLADSTEEEGGT